MQRQDLYSYIKDFAKFEDLQRGMEQLGIYLSDEEVMVIF